MSDKMISVALFPGPGEQYIIARHPTGVSYSGECGGLECTHPELEGYAIPLERTYGPYMLEFFKSVEDHWSWDMDMEEDVVNKVRACVNRFKRKNRHMSDFLMLEFDEEYRGPMGEAWIPVRFRIGQLKGSGVLVYENSD